MRKKLINEYRIKIGFYLNIFVLKSKGLFFLNYFLFVINEIVVVFFNFFFKINIKKNDKGLKKIIYRSYV